jgi:hypothetical protein
MAPKVQNIRTPAQRRTDIFNRISDEQLRCMAGGRHRFPTDELDPKSTTPPPGFNAVLRKGVYSITEECLRGCGRIRKFSTRSGGLFDTDTVYQYSSRREGDWVTINADDRDELDIRPRTVKAVLFDRNTETLKRIAVRAS